MRDADYILYIDEAGDDKVASLKPTDETGNSEWLCLGGYLIRSVYKSDLNRRRDEILLAIGGQPGGVLHYKNLKAKNRRLAVRSIANTNSPARGFVVCSYKATMLNYENSRAARSAVHQRDYLFNFVCRLLLERVTEYVVNDAKRRGIRDSKLDIVMASRRGHHFGRFKAYVYQLIHQATAGSTYLDTRTIRPEVLDWNRIQRRTASDEAGIQLADTLVSAVHQSLEQCSPHFSEKLALHLKPLIARRNLYGDNGQRAGTGLTLYPAPQAAKKLTKEQLRVFTEFGYDFAKLSHRTSVAYRPRGTQEQRIWNFWRDK